MKINLLSLIDKQNEYMRNGSNELIGKINTCKFSLEQTEKFILSISNVSMIRDKQVAEKIVKQLRSLREISTEQITADICPLYMKAVYLSKIIGRKIATRQGVTEDYALFKNKYDSIKARIGMANV